MNSLITADDLSIFKVVADHPPDFADCVFSFLLLLSVAVVCFSNVVLHSGRKCLPTDSLFFQINLAKTYRYRYRSVIIWN